MEDLLAGLKRHVGRGLGIVACDDDRLLIRSSAPSGSKVLLDGPPSNHEVLDAARNILKGLDAAMAYARTTTE